MRKYNLGKSLTTFALMWAMMILPMMVTAQTRIKMPENDYKIQEDVKAGQQASREVEQQMPILNDYRATNYVQDIGRRLVNAIPREFQHREFRYTFKIVNASDINAFALPGGPMYINRGMIEAAKNEGEMAGVMAHEISHVALRHATANASKQNDWQTQLGTLGAILGGAILGGETGAQLGMLGVQAWQTKYSRGYETQADVLGAKIMANAGYDPRDLANMFRTIAQAGGSRGPEFLSSHPNPENRYEKIYQEARYLEVARNPTQNTRDFEYVQNRLERMPKAPTMEQIARSQQGQRQGQRQGQGQGQGTNRGAMANGRYSSRVQYPSTRTQVYRGGNFVTMRIPSNWEQFPGQTDVWFAPRGAYGQDGITHGATVGIINTQNRDLYRATQDYVNGLLQSNNYLRRTSRYTQGSIDRRNAYMTTLSGRSPITRDDEIVNVYTTQLRNGSLFYIITVAPRGEFSRYDRAFNDLIGSINLRD